MFFNLPIILSYTQIIVTCFCFTFNILLASQRIKMGLEIVPKGEESIMIWDFFSYSEIIFECVKGKKSCF